MALLDTPVCEFGWPAPDFTLQDPHGRRYALDDIMGEAGLVVAFICNHCPYVKAIAQRLAEDTKMLMDAGAGVVAVMSNSWRDYPEDSPSNMLKFADKYGFDFPYLVDENQSVAKSYGAVCTPDFFGFNRNGELQYRGRLDNIGIGGDPSNRQTELLDAMALIADTGEGPREQVPSMGCSIKWM
ncbi:MAG: thioredoxin family protein [Pseudomonadota bacterium]